MLKYMKFCTKMTIVLLLVLRGIFRLGIHPSMYCYTLRNTFSMDAKMYQEMPTEKYFDGLGGQLKNVMSGVTKLTVIS